ncbi:sigma 54-interacting transcriptional regulator [Oligoflexus sp.]|uniref:sigma 54-interacting transcriptional regulator n=1 Tax=Oligoflexus sp. TaxID=1971216 RepID=UPI002D7A0035|nr:sigma 54-interacting transcriptional regulator [Oligoflexus sp.]
MSDRTQRQGAGSFRQKEMKRMGRASRKECVPGLELVRLVDDSLWSRYQKEYPYGLVIGCDEITLLKGLAANAQAPIVITGETGTGKEEMAKLLHRFRCDGEGRIPFVIVNCATIAESLCESLLFGHRRGAFTGADASTNGYIHEASGGILFLDEIHTIPLSIQQKLLRVMNDGTFNRLGETSQLHSRFQLVAASTRDLDDEVDEGRFLLDLRSRLTGIDIHLLPLRDRKADLPALVARRFSDNGVSISGDLFAQLVEYLAQFHWRGNIRQLFKAIDTWILMASVKGQPLCIEGFPVFKGMLTPASKGCESATEESPEEASLHIDLFKEVLSGRNMLKTMDALEALMISSALKKHRTISEAAKALGLPRSTIDAKRRKYGLATSTMQC